MSNKSALPRLTRQLQMKYDNIHYSVIDILIPFSTRQKFFMFNRPANICIVNVFSESAFFESSIRDVRVLTSLFFHIIILENRYLFVLYFYFAKAD